MDIIKKKGIIVEKEINFQNLPEATSKGFFRVIIKSIQRVVLRNRDTSCRY
jgi:hypothetical protein